MNPPASSTNALLAAFDPEEGRDIVVPIHDGQRGNPVLWGAKYFPDLLALTGDTGARGLLSQNMERVAEVDCPTNAILRDFDTADALKALSAPQNA